MTLNISLLILVSIITIILIVITLKILESIPVILHKMKINTFKRTGEKPVISFEQLQRLKKANPKRWKIEEFSKDYPYYKVKYFTLNCWNEVYLEGNGYIELIEYMKAEKIKLISGNSNLVMKEIYKELSGLNTY